MCQNFPFIGEQRGHDALAKIKQLTLDCNKHTKETIGWLYSALTILDAKANGLLRVNSLLITLLTALLGLARLERNPLNITHDQVATAVLGLGSLIVSTIFCFMIVRVNWKFLSHVVLKPDKTTYDFEREAQRLANIVDNRTHYYSIGWVLTLIVLVLPILEELHAIPSFIMHPLQNLIPAPALYKGSP
jgi:hypothetical protein